MEQASFKIKPITDIARKHGIPGSRVFNRHFIEQFTGTADLAEFSKRVKHGGGDNEVMLETGFEGMSLNGKDDEGRGRCLEEEEVKGSCGLFEDMAGWRRVIFWSGSGAKRK